MLPLCLITEFLENGSLIDYLKNPDNKVDISLQIRLIRGIANGMRHLQLEHIIHKGKKRNDYKFNLLDLAARNILLSKDLSPKVSDFGLSKIMPASTVTVYSKTDVGPIKWMSPESLQKKVYSHKSDVWSFGITCLEVFLRHTPYEELDVSFLSCVRC